MLEDEEERETEDDEVEDISDLSEEEINRHLIEIIPGQWMDAVWLALDNTWLQVKKTQSVRGNLIYWECRFRRIAMCLNFVHKVCKSYGCCPPKLKK